MVGATFGIVVFILVMFNSIIPTYGQSPCPSIFRLVNSKFAGEILGRIEIPNAPRNIALHIRINLSVAALLPTKYVGDLDLATSQDDAVLAVEHGRPLLYKLRFPIQNPIPSVTAITFNGQRYCSGPPATGSTVTSITLEHTLFPPGVNTLSSYRPATTINDYSNDYGTTNMKDYFKNRPSTSTNDYFNNRPTTNRNDLSFTNNDDFFNNIPSMKTDDFFNNHPSINNDDFFNNHPSINSDDFFNNHPSINSDDFFNSHSSINSDDFFNNHPSINSDDFFNNHRSISSDDFFNNHPSVSSFNSPAPNIKDVSFNFPVPSGITNLRNVTFGSNQIPIVKPVTTVPISIQLNRPAEQPRPEPPVLRPRPELPALRPRPEPPVERPRPVFTTERPRPVLTTERPRPIFTTERPRPIFTTERRRPVPTTERPRPIFTTERPRPVPTTERPRPVIPEERPQPAIPTAEPQPVLPTPVPTANPQNPFLNPPPINLERNCGRPSVVNHLIAHGESTMPGQWPWIAAIFIARMEYEFLCGGSLITERHVVTAAHCKITEDGEMPASAFLVALGRYHLMEWREEGSMTFEVLEFRTHPGYVSKNSADSDIGLIVLREKVPFTSKIQPLCLWTRQISLENVVGLNGYVVGWGTDENGNLHLHEPRLAQMPIVSQASCRESHLAFTRATSNRTFCAGRRDGSGPCNGDSGSSLVIRDSVTGRFYLRGIVSVSPDNGDSPICDHSQFVVYVDAAQYLDWIRIQTIYT